MKRIGLISILLVVVIIIAHSQDTIVDIPDTAFFNALRYEGVDTNGDSLISYAEAEAVTSLDVKGNDGGGNISNMTGIEAFINLVTLDCSNNQITSLNVSGCTVLRELRLEGNKLTNLDVSNNTALELLNCRCNQLTSLDVSNLSALRYLYCEGTTPTTSCGEDINSIISLNVSGCTSLRELKCEGNLLTSLDVSTLDSLEILTCGWNDFTSLDVSNNISLERLSCGRNRLISLDVSTLSSLEVLACGWNEITSLDLCTNTSLKEVRLGNMPSLDTVYVWETPFPPAGTQVYASGSPNIVFINCDATDLTEYYEDACYFYPNPTYTLLNIETSYFGLYHIVITSMNGQKMFSTSMDGSTNQIDLSSFQNGVYFVTIRSKDFVNTKKIAKLGDF